MVHFHIWQMGSSIRGKGRAHYRQCSGFCWIYACSCAQSSGWGLVSWCFCFSADRSTCHLSLKKKKKPLNNFPLFLSILGSISSVLQNNGWEDLSGSCWKNWKRDPRSRYAEIAQNITLPWSLIQIFPFILSFLVRGMEKTKGFLLLGQLVLQH